MAQKRMFDKRITDSDKFMDLPNSSKALYFMAGMSADDRGFFQPRKLQKLCGFTDDDYKVLIAKGYLIPFESGVMVITDWNKNNYLDKNRITETEYLDELKLLRIINEKYELETPRLTDVKPMFNQYSIEENRIEKNRKEYNIYGEFQNVKLTEEEYEKIEEKNLTPYIEKLSCYLENNPKKKYASHYATILTWDRKDNKEQKQENVPDWFGKENQKQDLSNDDVKEIEDLLNNM